MDDLSAILEHKGREVFAVEPDATVQEVASEMNQQRVGALMVLERGRPAGIVSERDILSKVVAARRDPAATRAKEIMTRDVVCIGLHASPEQAMSVMTERRLRHLPVVLDGRVIGLVSIGDLVRWASRHQQHEIEMLNDYLCGKYPG
jgi:CBS domain-containing protein